MNKKLLGLACVVALALELFTVALELGRAQGGQQQGERTRLLLQVPLPFGGLLGGAVAAARGAFRRDKLQPELKFSNESCQLDFEGTWSIGLFAGASPLALRPFQSTLPADLRPYAVPNPIITCAMPSNPPSNFVADPFLYFHDNGTWYLFFETKTNTDEQGDIGVAASEDRGLSWQYVGRALDEAHHLSYPHIIRWRNETYMLPEQFQGGKLWLYRAVDFPLRWERAKMLLNTTFADSTMVEWKGRWWMFTSPMDPGKGGGQEQLYIFYADTPLGPWQPHAQNPVMVAPDRRGARMGGSLAKHRGKLIRFGQDCSEAYGHSVVAYRIDRLTPTRFNQTEIPFSVLKMGPGTSQWNGVRMHHVDAHQLPDGGWVVAMDGDNRRG